MRLSELRVLALRWLRQLAARRCHENWFIAIRPRSGRDVLAGDMGGFRIVVAPRGHFFADPFLIEWNGRHYVFFEEFEFKSSNGKISYCELDSDGRPSELKVALEAEHHLSYPFVFGHEDSLYLLPEMAEAGEPQLYRADAFPGPFVPVCAPLRGIRAVDPTIYQTDDGFWLLAGEFDGNPHDRLNLYWAERLDGPWTEHALNPVLHDRSGARPAGALFEAAGQLVRPAQDCSARYGGSVVFKQVLRLDEHGLEESEIARIAPGWLRGNLGTHTYNRDSSFEVVDGRWLSSGRWWLDLLLRGCFRVLGVAESSDIRDLPSWLSPAARRRG